MILVESDKHLFNFSNANVIDFVDNEIHVYFNQDNVIRMKGYDSIDNSEFDEYFFKYANENRRTYFNKYTFLFLMKLDDGIIQFNFYENSQFEITMDYDILISQVD